MHIIAYTSEIVSPHEADAILAQIQQQSVPKNSAMGITGMLLYDNGRFLQVIEGDRQTLEVLMQVISTDPRHKNIKYLLNESARTRSFPDWNMACFNLSKHGNFNAETLQKIRDVYKANFIVDAENFIQAILLLIDNAVMQSQRSSS